MNSAITEHYVSNHRIVLKKEELEKLLIRYRNGDTRVKDELIKSQIDMCVRVAHKYARNHPHLSEDIYSVSFLTLVNCVNNLYDTSKPFINYVKDNINYQIRLFLTKQHDCDVDLEEVQDYLPDQTDDLHKSIWLEELSQQLSIEERNIIILKLQGYTLEDIATVYHVPRNRIKTIINLNIYPTLRDLIRREEDL